MTLTKIRLAAVAALSAVMFSPLAQAEGLSFNIGAVSLYKSNGVDQDSRQGTQPKNVRPAIQGGIDYAFSNGFYVGNWNSTGHFGEARSEIDLYAGYGGELGNGVSYDIGYARYIYPGEGSWNGNELYGSVSYGIFKVKVTRGTHGSIRKHSRLGLSLSQPLSKELTLNAGVGIRNKANFNSGASDYSVGLSYDMGNDFSASATLSGSQTSKYGDAGKARLVLGIAKTF